MQLITIFMLLKNNFDQEMKTLVTFIISINNIIDILKINRVSIIDSQIFILKKKGS